MYTLTVVVADAGGGMERAEERRAGRREGGKAAQNRKQ